MSPTAPPDGAREPVTWGPVALALAVAALVTLSGLVVLYRPGMVQLPLSPSAACTGRITVEDSTPLLGSAFSAGAIWGSGGNDTSVLLGGTRAYVQSTDFNVPALSEVTGSASNAVGQNLSSLIAPYFVDGGVYAETWNGSAWLIGGQADFNGTPVPALVSWSAGRITNLTGRIASDFVQSAPSQAWPDWGVWETDWNGSAWLVAGNGSRGAVLLSIEGDEITDLSPALAPSAQRGYITLLAWNGTGWIVGGYQVLESYFDGQFVNWLPASPFSDSGAFGADWSGTSWLIGGGTPTALALLTGDRLTDGPAMPASFRNAWINDIVYVPSDEWAAGCSGWMIAGLGLVASARYSGALAVWMPTLAPGVVDLTDLLPASFQGGEVEDETWAPNLGTGVLLLSGQGHLNLDTGFSTGALATLDLDGTES